LLLTSVPKGDCLKDRDSHEKLHWGGNEGDRYACPPSLADNPGLLAWNLFVMTAAFCLGLMMAGQQARRLWRTRDIDHPKDPVSIYRIIVFLPDARSPVGAVPKRSACGRGAREM
jgi:hypothetical protein